MQVMNFENRKVKIIVNDNTIQYNGDLYEIPQKLQGEFKNVRSINHNTFFINGWEFIPKKGKFKRTFRGWLECYFIPIFM